MFRPDSLIFDMDGTLWDAVDSYARVWDATMGRLGIAREPVTRAELIGFMGQPMTDIVRGVVPGEVDVDSFMVLLDEDERRIVSRDGGEVYPGVMELVPRLAERMPLFLVSNCGVNGLDNLLDYTGLRPYFTENITFGSTGRSKAENIRDLCRRRNLQRAIYIGDTEGDCRAAHQAGVPFAWAAYGFGTASNPEFTLHKFSDLAAIAGLASQ